MKTIIIDWIRHAESCANFESYNIFDIELDNNRKTGYDIRKEYNKNINLEEYQQFAYMYKQNMRKNNNNKEFKKLHPNLTYIGMQHSILLSDHIANKKYDIVYVSPLFRTIMTALLSLRGKDIKIYVIPFINEIVKKKKNNDNYENKVLSCDLLKRQTMFIKDWLEENWFISFDDIKFISLLKKLQENILNDNVKNIIDNIMISNNINQLREYIDNLRNYIPNTEKQLYNNIANMLTREYIRGPKVDFSIYDKLTNLIDVTKSDFDKFYNIILPYSFKKLYIDNNKENILIGCYSHGNIMKDYFTKKYNKKILYPMNTQIFRETIIYDNNLIEVYKINLDDKEYIPDRIRDKYENFEKLNPNVCDKQSIRGIINYPLLNKDTKHMIPSIYRNTIGLFATLDTKKYINDDSKFIFENNKLDNYYKTNENNLIE